ncbi:MAG: rhodanese-like domain-containing protein [Flavihumibacter sp.]
MGLLFNLFGSKEKTDYRQLLQEGAIIVDVRSRSEFAGGHVNASINIPLAELPQQVGVLKKKNQVVTACCQSGARSAVAASKLSAAGIIAHNGGSWRSLAQALR